MGLLDNFEEVLRALEFADKQVPSISGWSVAQQVEHVLLANKFMLGAVVNPDSDFVAEGGLSLLGRVVLLLGRIPRGKAKAPELSVPEGLSADEHQQIVEEVRGLIADVVKYRDDIISDRRGVAKHPYFGPMTRKQWLRLVEVHQHHHLKIIREILSSS